MSCWKTISACGAGWPRAGLDDEARERLAGMAARLESWLALGGRGDQACPCGSGKRYRNCCSRLVASAS